MVTQLRTPEATEGGKKGRFEALGLLIGCFYDIGVLSNMMFWLPIFDLMILDWGWERSNCICDWLGWLVRPVLVAYAYCATHNIGYFNLTINIIIFV